MINPCNILPHPWFVFLSLSFVLGLLSDVNASIILQLLGGELDDSSTNPQESCWLSVQTYLDACHTALVPRDLNEVIAPEHPERLNVALAMRFNLSHSGGSFPVVNVDARRSRPLLEVDAVRRMVTFARDMAAMLQ